MTPQRVPLKYGLTATYVTRDPIQEALDVFSEHALTQPRRRRADEDTQENP